MRGNDFVYRRYSGYANGPVVKETGMMTNARALAAMGLGLQCAVLVKGCTRDQHGTKVPKSTFTGHYRHWPELIDIG